jgi:hypothetical protein
MGVEKNQELLRYYKDRRAWLLEADEIPPKLSAYTVDRTELPRATAEEKPGYTSQ